MRCVIFCFCIFHLAVDVFLRLPLYAAGNNQSVAKLVQRRRTPVALYCFAVIRGCVLVFVAWFRRRTRFCNWSVTRRSRPSRWWSHDGLFNNRRTVGASCRRATLFTSMLYCRQTALLAPTWPSYLSGSVWYVHVHLRPPRCRRRLHADSSTASARTDTFATVRCQSSAADKCDQLSDCLARADDSRSVASFNRVTSNVLSDRMPAGTTKNPCGWGPSGCSWIYQRPRYSGAVLVVAGTRLLLRQYALAPRVLPVSSDWWSQYVMSTY